MKKFHVESKSTAIKLGTGGKAAKREIQQLDGGLGAKTWVRKVFGSYWMFEWLEP